MSISPKVIKGAFIQLAQGLVSVEPNVVVFQYNPAKLTHALTPWNPFEGDQAQRGAQAPNVQPFNPKETFSLVLELDAADGLASGDPLTLVSGIAPQLAALKKLTLPSQGVLGDLVASAQALVGAAASTNAVRPTVPILLFMWGPGLILPVRITSFSIEVSLFSPLLDPLQANVTMAIEVLTPDLFKCREDVAVKIAKAAFNMTKTKENALALLNISNSAQSVLGMLPI
jgi:hypothetical protein